MSKTGARVTKGRKAGRRRGVERIWYCEVKAQKRDTMAEQQRKRQRERRKGRGTYFLFE